MLELLTELRTVSPEMYDYLQQFGFLGTVYMMIRIEKRVARLDTTTKKHGKQIRALTPPPGVTARAASEAT